MENLSPLVPRIAQFTLGIGQQVIECLFYILMTGIATLAFSIDGTKLLIRVAKEKDTYSYIVHSIEVPFDPTGTDTQSVVSMREWKSLLYPTPKFHNIMCNLTMALSMTW